MKRGLAALLLLVAMGVAGCAPGPAKPPQSAPSPLPATVSGAQRMIGVFEPGVPLSYAPVEHFSASTGVKPQITLWYGGWGDPFRAAFANQAAQHGALPFVQINPGRIAMSAVAAGKGDAYLRSYASQVRDYGKPVIIGFAAEPNGTWDQWGRGRTPASQWVEAWRHVVTLFRAEGARNVIWLWTVNSAGTAGDSNLSAWWPGAAYVTWIGIDGYYARPEDTFASVFGDTLSQLRKFTQKPVLLSETAVGPAAGTAKIASVFAGAEADHLLGLVWFDQTQNNGVYHQDWRLEDSPAALAAFRSAARKYKE